MVCASVLSISEAPVPDRSTLHEAIDAHLRSLHSTLWGRAFDVNSEPGRAAAVEWLAAQIESVNHHYLRITRRP